MYTYILNVFKYVNEHARVSDYCFWPNLKTFQLYHGKKKLLLMRWCLLCSWQIHWAGFSLLVPLKPQFTDRHVIPHNCIIHIQTQQVFLILQVENQQIQVSYSLVWPINWFNPATFFSLSQVMTLIFIGICHRFCLCSMIWGER